MEDFDLSPQTMLLVNVVAFFIAIALATHRYVRDFFSSRRAPGTAASSPIGDIKMFGAALNDSYQLNRIAEQLECLCDHAKDCNKHQEVIADELKAIRKIMGRREDRGDRQES